MKKHIIAIVFLCIALPHAHAQQWLDALKGIATQAIDSATGGKLTQIAIVGEWHYAAPATKLSSNDTLTSLGGSAISSVVNGKIEDIATKIGIKEGLCSITFNNDNTFSMPIAKKAIDGQYTFDAATHEIVLTIGKFANIKGKAYINGEELQLLFPTEKFMDFIIALGSKVSALKSVTSLLEKYDNIELGLAFKK